MTVPEPITTFGIVTISTFPILLSPAAIEATSTSQILLVQEGKAGRVRTSTSQILFVQDGKAVIVTVQDTGCVVTAGSIIISNLSVLAKEAVFVL